MIPSHLNKADREVFRVVPLNLGVMVSENLCKVFKVLLDNGVTKSGARVES